jgi:hypothetical protein
MNIHTHAHAHAHTNTNLTSLIPAQQICKTQHRREWCVPGVLVVVEISVARWLNREDHGLGKFEKIKLYRTMTMKEGLIKYNCAQKERGKLPKAPSELVKPPEA